MQLSIQNKGLSCVLEVWSATIYMQTWSQLQIAATVTPKDDERFRAMSIIEERLLPILRKYAT